MNQQQSSYMPISERLVRGQFDQNVVATFLIVGYVGLIGWMFVSSRGGENLDRVLFSTFIFMLLGVAWWNQAKVTQAKAVPWQRLAAQTGLHCVVGGFWAGYSVAIEGEYRNRTLNMYTRAIGTSAEVTRIEVGVPNSEQTTLKIRGPFAKKEIMYDRVMLQMIGDTTVQKADPSSHFLLGSNSATTIEALQSDRVWWSEAARLRRLTTIELERQTVIFEQVGVVRDVGKLHTIYDLLSDLADTLERD